MLSWDSGWTTANPPETARMLVSSSHDAPTRVARLSPSPLQAVILVDDIRKNCLLAPLSSTISTRPGFSCSMEGTWLARTPISPPSAGMLTWTLFRASVRDPIPPRRNSPMLGPHGKEGYARVRLEDGLCRRQRLAQARIDGQKSSMGFVIPDGEGSRRA